MAEIEDNKIKELLRRTKLTTKSRYRAGERLETHHKISQWTVAFISCALIVIPLVQSYGVPVNSSTQLLNTIQSVLAVMVLVIRYFLAKRIY